jgi:hypothetical protein
VSESEGDRRSAPPPPARSAAPDGEVEEGRTPTPARALLEEAETRAPPSTSEPETEEATLESGDERWTVRVAGHGRSGSAGGAAPLLLLSFFRAGSAEPELESLVVGHSLGALSEEDLLAGLRRARTPPEPGSRKEIFPEVGGRRRDRDG